MTDKFPNMEILHSGLLAMQPTNSAFPDQATSNYIQSVARKIFLTPLYMMGDTKTDQDNDQCPNLLTSHVRTMPQTPVLLHPNDFFGLWCEMLATNDLRCFLIPENTRMFQE